MTILQPSTSEELAAALRESAAAGRPIRLGGAFTKSSMGGPLPDAQVCVSTRKLTAVRQYEPHDLTISVEAGMPFAELECLLATHRQMIPLDPPFLANATVGGVVAANCAGPRRRLYGTARDLIIGMTFVTLEGKHIQTGGMVVKNVAGLDMAKLLTGSFGTLAAIAVVNFKVQPAPLHSRSFLRPFETAQDCFAARDAVLRSVLQPAAADILNPAASELCGQSGWLLALRAGGSTAVLHRYSLELPAFTPVEDEAESAFWRQVREFTPDYLSRHPNGAVVQLSTTLQGVRLIAEAAPGPAIVRAGTGVAYVHLPEASQAPAWLSAQPVPGLIQFSPEAARPNLDLWPQPGSAFDTMVRIKQLFDPQSLLNRGRLYGRI